MITANEARELAKSVVIWVHDRNRLTWEAFDLGRQYQYEYMKETVSKSGEELKAGE